MTTKTVSTWLARACATFLFATLVWQPGAARTRVRGEAIADPSPSVRRGRTSLDDVTLGFVERRGSRRAGTSYVLDGEDARVSLAPDGVTVVSKRVPGGPTREATMHVGFEGGRAGSRPRPEPGEPTTRVSVFAGSRADWRVGVPSYSAVRYSDVWPGVDVVFRAEAARLRFQFVVRPGADPRRIALEYSGATGASLDDDGGLVLRAAAGSLRAEAPITIQDGARVASAFDLSAKDATGHVRVRFRLGAYDAARPLVVAPTMVVYSGFLGGADPDTAFDVAVDAAGNAYVVGTTTSTPADGFPVAGGPDLTYDAGDFCVDVAGGVNSFVAKVKADGSGLEYCGYIGGKCSQIATGVAVDAAGDAYVAGFTATSPANGFPVTVGPSLDYHGGGYLGDGFVAKVSPDGTDLLYCGYVGGEANDQVLGLAIDAAGRAYLTGLTESKTSFPLVGGPSTAFGGGVSDAFVARVKADGTGLEYCGYLGGNGNDQAAGIAVDATGAAYVAGTTDSTSGLAVAVGPDPHNAGGVDAFVARVRPDGSGLAYCGYIGGSGADAAARVAIDRQGAAYVVGATNSSEATFPVAVGPDLTFSGSGMDSDAFVAKVSPDGSRLTYCGYVGGAAADAALGVAVSPSGVAYIVGATLSDEGTFPVTGGDGRFRGGSVYGDGFVSAVAADGSAFTFSGYIGGTDDDVATAVALGASGAVFVVGSTRSTPASFPVAIGPSLTPSGLSDVFVAKLAFGPPGPALATVEKQGKKLVVTGSSFDSGAKILVNDRDYKAKPDPSRPTERLLSPKAGKAATPGDRVRVRNGDGQESNELVFGG